MQGITFGYVQLHKEKNGTITINLLSTVKTIPFESPYVILNKSYRTTQFIRYLQ